MNDIRIEECVTSAALEAVGPVLLELRTHVDPATLSDRVARARTSGYRLYGAWEGARVVGAMGLRPVDNLAFGFHLYVDDLVVRETDRSRGVGEAMIRFAEQLARGWGAGFLRLDSGFARTRAHAFYERIGLPKVGYGFRVGLR
ncbi:MAG: GNAT family N-acetyltransferase [Myxococcales bacterium]|nr:GNAT family N-acetyltransferase [Myxococcales bacterium]